MNQAHLRQNEPQNYAQPERTTGLDVSKQGSVNVLIMNLPFRVRWQDLKDLCRQACPIERADVALEFDGRSRGFGEVTCFSAADAEKLFNMFDGYEWQNRRLNVIVMPSQNDAIQDGIAGSITTERMTGPVDGIDHRSHPEFRAPSSIMQPQVATDDKLLFVGNLPFSMQWQDLKDLLRPAGRVQRTDISIGNDGRSRGWGTALFYTTEEARKAVDMFNDMEVEGRKIKVRLDRLGVRGVPVQPMHNRFQQMPSGGQPFSRPTNAGYPLQQQQHPNHHAPYRDPGSMISNSPQSYQFGQLPPQEDGRSFRPGNTRQGPWAADSRTDFYPGARSYWPPPQ